MIKDLLLGLALMISGAIAVTLMLESGALVASLVLALVTAAAGGIVVSGIWKKHR